jgi:hypothetical protein
MEVLDIASETGDGGNTVKNTYRIIPGISTREGALRILEEMDYPPEMLSTVKNISFETSNIYISGSTTSDEENDEVEETIEIYSDSIDL